MNKYEKIKEWIKFAEMDRETVNILNDYYNKPNEIICYHCQQTVEKYLKACLIMYDFPVIKTHDLLELNLICSQKNDCFNKILDDCNYLTSFGVQARYPEHKFDLNSNNVINAIQYMNNACNVIIDILNVYMQQQEVSNKISNKTEENEDEI